MKKLLVILCLCGLYACADETDELQVDTKSIDQPSLDASSGAELDVGVYAQGLQTSTGG